MKTTWLDNESHRKVKIISAEKSSDVGKCITISDIMKDAIDIYFDAFDSDRHFVKKKAVCLTYGNYALLKDYCEKENVSMTSVLDKILENHFKTELSDL